MREPSGGGLEIGEAVNWAGLRTVWPVGEEDIATVLRAVSR